MERVVEDRVEDEELDSLVLSEELDAMIEAIQETQQNS